jgi:hypothetical protein
MLGTISNCLKYKKHFYLKSLNLKTDFSLYRKAFKNWHPQYFDVPRHTEYQEKKRDYRRITFNLQDPLYFDYQISNLNGGFERVTIL